MADVKCYLMNFKSHSLYSLYRQSLEGYSKILDGKTKILMFTNVSDTKFLRFVDREIETRVRIYDLFS